MPYGSYYVYYKFNNIYFMITEECLNLKTKTHKVKENKDEEIRKELISHFKYLQKAAIEKNIPEKWYGLSYDDIIAWLEKSK